MKEAELISIIVPIYNVEQYLPTCIDSILAQTYRELEIILVDDGATDNSGKICDQYAAKDNRIRVIHKPNGGVSSARNAGIDAATGGVIGFVDGDDTIDSEMYKTLYADMCEHSADIACCGYRTLRGEKTEIRQETGELTILNQRQGLINFLSGEKIQPNVYCKLYRAELFNGLRFNNDIHFGEDLLINFYLFQRAKKSVFCDLCLYNYLKRENSCTGSRFGEKNIEGIYVQRVILKELENSDSEIFEYGESMLIKALVYTYNDSLSCPEYEGLRQEILVELKKKRRKIIKSDIYGKHQKAVIAMITTLPQIHRFISNIKNHRYRYKLHH